MLSEVRSVDGASNQSLPEIDTSVFTSPSLVTSIDASAATLGPPGTTFPKFMAPVADKLHVDGNASAIASIEPWLLEPVISPSPGRLPCRLDPESTHTSPLPS